MRTWTAASLAAALIAAWGCQTSAPADKPAEAGPAPAAPAPEAKAPAPVAPGQAAGAEWEEILRKLKANYEVGEQAKASQADEHYRLAERYYQAGDFEKAELECEKAIQINPNHAAAQALVTEVRFILGKGGATPASREYDKYMQEAIVRHQQTLVEIDNAHARGTRHYNRGEYDAAEREFRKILEYAKWMPTGVELETRRRQALDMLERTKESRASKNIEEEKARLKMIEEEKQRDDLKRLIDQRRELELLFGQAQMHFEREEYRRCISVCEKILYINPNITSVAEMRNVAQRLEHMRLGRDNLKNYIEEWKRTFEQIELNGMVQAEELEFPDMETWRELISKRRPKGIAELDEDIKPEDKEILDKLKSIRITIDMQNAPLTAIVDYIREISGLNIHITGIENPEQEVISFKVQDIVLDGALRLMLGPRQKGYMVRDGVVLITTQDALKKQVKLELYDVQDLTYGMQDFPGVDISLAQDAIGTTIAQGEEVVQQFTGEDLANLIKNTIHKNEWEEADGKSIQFNNGLLIVRNAVEVHKAVRKFLSDLRASTSMLVSVEARFLSVEDNFLQQVGMDFRDVDGARVQGITTLADINPTFFAQNNPQFLPTAFGAPPPGTAVGTANSAGITGVFGDSIARSMGARIQQIMTNDFLVQRFFGNVLSPLGGATLQYTLLDDISLETIVRLISRSERNHVLTAPKLTLFNTQRGNFRISNQMAYVRDYDVQIATAAVALDPIVDVVSDGISLDVRPVVSADRRFVTLELRPTIATLFPPPPGIFTITTNVVVPGAPVTDPLPVTIETPLINIQRIRTTVVVPDRGTLMLGGLTVMFDEDAESSIPIWRSIPIVGNLGSMKVKGLQRKQTLIIVRCRIIIPDEEERRRF
jgi:type II secretory pathway component GspD/PulD (secretin)/tetratricopeptide (TPR) repeat protein